MNSYKQHIANGSECLADALSEIGQFAGSFEYNNREEIEAEKQARRIARMEAAEPKGFSWNQVDACGFSGNVFAGWYLIENGMFSSANRSDVYRKTTRGFVKL